MNKKLIILVVVICLIAIILASIDFSKINFGPERVSFEEVCANKEKYYGGLGNFLFENGTVVWMNQTQRVNIAIIVPIPLPKGELEEKDYIAVNVPEALKVGDEVNIEGYLKKAEHEGKTLYYIDAEWSSQKGHHFYPKTPIFKV